MTEPPVVERPKTAGGPPDSAVRLRLRQQEILAELGVLALQGTPFPDLIDHTVNLTAEGMEAEFCKVLEYQPGENRFLVRAGVGWEPGIVGVATIGADLESPAGFALKTGRPVISNHLGHEDRFRTPELLLRYGIHRAINVILQGAETPFGVLEVDSRAKGEFGESDLAFLQGAANILGMAIERQRMERDLNAALERHQTLLHEVNHRIKNSLQLVVGMLRLQADATDLPDIKRSLEDASGRISAIARAHQRLYVKETVQTVDLGGYLTEICHDVDEVAAHCTIEIAAPAGIEIAIDRAIPLALLVNELILNAAKHAYEDGAGCHVWVTLERRDGGITVSVRDAGVGLPPGFDPARSRGLGMRIVSAFTRQLQGELQTVAHAPGTEFIVTVPLAD